ISQGQEGPRCTHEQHLEAYSESEGWEAAQIVKALRIISPPSSHSLMSGNMEEVPAAETPSTHQDPWSGCSSSTAITTTSSSKSDEGSRSPDKEESPITSHSPRDIEHLPIDSPDEMVPLVVQFLLYKYQVKELITKEEMLDIVMDDFLEIPKRTSEGIELVFSVDLKEVEPTSHCYALTNKLGLTFDARMSGDEHMPNTSLLIIMPGTIFMKGNCATKEEIWEVLNMMDLYYSGTKHFHLWEPRKFTTEDFVQENYVQYRQVPNSHPPCYEFLWGPRAHTE
uniref:MAGE domain-containing protein n=1 Tax=Loxodonta africana TaxID=9785 RepID=G3UJP0_LOXAF